jgi:hypothetical protein
MFAKSLAIRDYHEVDLYYPFPETDLSAESPKSQG